MIVACTLWKLSSKHHESSYSSSLSRRGGCREVLQKRYPGVTQQFVKCINLCTTLEQRLQTRVPQIEEQLLMQVCTSCAQKNSTTEWESTMWWVSKSWNWRVTALLNLSTTSWWQQSTPATAHFYTNMNEWPQWKYNHTPGTSLYLGVSKECLGLKMRRKRDTRM